MNIFFKVIVLLGLSCRLYAGDIEKREELQLSFPAAGEKSFGVVVPENPTFTTVFIHFQKSGGSQYPYQEQHDYWSQCAKIVKTGRHNCLKRAQGALMASKNAQMFQYDGGMLYPHLGDVVNGVVFTESNITTMSLEKFAISSGLYALSPIKQMVFWRDVASRTFEAPIKAYCSKKSDELLKKANC